jgi:amino acid transporter
MFALGAIVIVAGFYFNHQDFAAAILSREGRSIAGAAPPDFQFYTYFAAAAVLFASFIGFDSIAQAGSEARNPSKTLPAAITIAVLSVGLFYFLFTAAIYHTVPWQYIAEESTKRDLTAPGLLGYLLSPGWTVAIVAGSAIALINDLPAMLLAVSRLMFAWAEDGIFPKQVAKVHRKWHTPHFAVILSGCMASIGILGSHLAGDFFLGVDILVTSMLVNFLLMCLSVIMLKRRNQALAAQISVVKLRKVQLPLAWLGIILLGGFLIIHFWKDFHATSAWYFHSTPVWLLVMAIASLIYWKEFQSLKKSGKDVNQIFSTLPEE